MSTLKRSDKMFSILDDLIVQDRYGYTQNHTSFLPLSFQELNLQLQFQGKYFGFQERVRIWFYQGVVTEVIHGDHQIQPKSLLQRKHRCPHLFHGCTCAVMLSKHLPFAHGLSCWVTGSPEHTGTLWLHIHKRSSSQVGSIRRWCRSVKVLKPWVVVLGFFTCLCCADRSAVSQLPSSLLSCNQPQYLS